MLAQWTWLIIAPAAPSVAPAADAALDGSAAAAAILKSGLFSGAGLTRREASAPTTLDLKLIAVVASKPGRAQSLAVLSLNGKASEVFREGGEITPGVVLNQVIKDHVVIRRQGVLERVDFPDVKRASGAAPASGLNVPQQGEGHSSFSRDALNRSPQAPAQLSQLGASSGVPGAGVVIGDAPSGSLAQKLSLQPGDTIKLVNGESVASQEDLLRLYQKFTSTGQVTLEGMRKGAPLKLTYTVNP